MKNFYSRSHALMFLGIQEATLQRAVNHGWIVPIRFRSRAPFPTEFFIHSDLMSFREKYRSGYYEPSEVMKRRRLQRKR